MRRGVGLSLIGLSSWLLACTSSLLSPGEVFELSRAERRWAARSFQAYSFEYQLICFCPPQVVRVSVNDGQVVGVVTVANDSALAPQQWAYFPTIDTLFAEIRRLSHEHDLRDVKVEYDPALGYPTLIETISQPSIADGGSAQYVRSLVATP